jgi:type IV pilus assembly protein PilC
MPASSEQRSRRSADQADNARFSYRAWSEFEGREVTGTIQARSVEAAKRMLSNRELLIADISRLPAIPLNAVRANHKISSKYLLPFWRQLSVELKAGSNFNAVLERMASSRSNSRTANLASDVVQRLEEGANYGQAFAAHTKEVGELAVALISSADQSGRIQQEFERLADITERQMKTLRAIRKALSYPMIVISVATVVVIAMMVFVIPTFKGIFASLGGTLPAPTRITMSVAQYAMTYWYLLLLGACAIAGGVMWAWRNPTARLKIDTFLLLIPKFGPFMLDGDLARSLLVMTGLYESGLNMMDEILPNVAQVANRRIIGNGWRFIAEQMADGRQMFVGMRLYNDELPGRRLEIFPESLIEQTEAAVHSGNYVELLGGFGRVLQERVENFTESIQKIIEPIMTVVLGAIIGWIVISLYLPMFDYAHLIQNMGNG